MTTLPSGEVTIAGRAFTLGAVYAPAPHVRPYEQGRLLPLRLVDYDPAYPWPEGRVEAELVPTGSPAGCARNAAGCPAGRGRPGRAGRGRREPPNREGVVADRFRAASTCWPVEPQAGHARQGDGWKGSSDPSPAGRAAAGSGGR